LIAYSELGKEDIAVARSSMIEDVIKGALKEYDIGYISEYTRL
jgi:hypothetical protein